MRVFHSRLKRWKMEQMMRSIALHVREADHGPSTTANLHETAFDDIGGAQLLPQVSGQAEEGQPFRQIRLQLSHHAGIRRAPALAESARAAAWAWNQSHRCLK